MLRSIAGHLAAAGHDVTVIASKPSYHSSTKNETPSRETIDGFNVIRLPSFRENKKNILLRGYNAISYSLMVRRHVLKVGDYDIVTAATFPPIIAAKLIGGAAKKTGAKFIYHFQDIHPELSLFAGQLKQNWIFKLLQKLDNSTCCLADELVVLSHDMASTLKSRKDSDKLQPNIINNFLLEKFDHEKQNDTFDFPQGKFVILFAGNIGKFQNLDKLIAAAQILKDNNDIQFWILGDGVAKNALKEQAGKLLSKTVFFLPFVHHSIAQEMMAKADLNVISLKPDIYRVSYPSKTFSIVASASAILGLVEEESELGTMIAEKNIGYVVNPTLPSDIAKTIETAYNNQDQISAYRENSAELHQSKLSKEIRLQQWSDLVGDLSNADK